MPRQLIFYAGHALRRRRNVAGLLRVARRLDHSAQQHLAVIAIDRYRVVVSDAVVGQRTLDLGDQQRVIGPLSRRVVMMLRRDVDAVMLARHGVRGVCRARVGKNIYGKQADDRTDRDCRQNCPQPSHQLLGVTVVDSLWCELELSTVPPTPDSLELLDLSIDVLLVVVGGITCTGEATTTWAGAAAGT